MGTGTRTVAHAPRILGLSDTTPVLSGGEPEPPTACSSIQCERLFSAIERMERNITGRLDRLEQLVLSCLPSPAFPSVASALEDRLSQLETNVQQRLGRLEAALVLP